MYFFPLSQATCTAVDIFILVFVTVHLIKSACENHEPAKSAAKLEPTFSMVRLLRWSIRKMRLSTAYCYGCEQSQLLRQLGEVCAGGYHLLRHD